MNNLNQQTRNYQNGMNTQNPPSQGNGQNQAQKMNCTRPESGTSISTEPRLCKSPDCFLSNKTLTGGLLDKA